MGNRDWLDGSRLMPFENTSGEIIPPYAVMELDYAFESGKSATELVDDVETRFHCKKPTSSGVSEPGRIVFNSDGAVPVDGYGAFATNSMTLAMFSDAEGDIALGDEVGPKAASWYLSKDGTGWLFQTNDSGKAKWDSASIRTIYVRPSGGSNSGVKLVQTPGGGIAARSGTTVGSGSCTEYKLVGTTLTTNTDTITVYNPWPIAIPGSFYITAVKEEISGQWIAQSPGLLNVRWVDPDLEQTTDGATYTNIDTAVDCT